jgi:chemotaxis response regulator CheB
MTAVQLDPSCLPVVALVCSLGGADALMRVLSPLPADLPAAIVALQHMDPRYESVLPERLSAATALQVRVAEDGARLRAGVVDVATRLVTMSIWRVGMCCYWSTVSADRLRGHLRTSC